MQESMNAAVFDAGLASASRGRLRAGIADAGGDARRGHRVGCQLPDDRADFAQSLDLCRC
jgi:hypothetical protein